MSSPQPTNWNFAKSCCTHSSCAARGGVDPALYPPTVRQRMEVQVRADRVTFADADADDISILRATVSFRIFALSTAPASDKREEMVLEAPLFQLSAAYRVEYQVREELTDEETQEFTSFNAVHNAWPFWRHHVFTTVSAAKLPRLAVPLFRRPPSEPQAKRTPRKIPKRLSSGTD